MRMRRKSNGARVATAAIATLVASVATLVAFTTGAPAAPTPPAPPAPSITAGPSGTVASTTATFAYKDSQAGVTFRCALDGGSFTGCPASGKAYSSLANGPHTFRVVAQNGNSPLSAAASRSWTVDVAAPTAALTFPADNGSYNAAGWAAGCTPVGLCGTATDATGVAGVQVAVYQGVLATGYTAATLQSPGATSTTWRLARPLPAPGTYSIRVRATDMVGNTTSLLGELAASFRIDGTAPPAPIILVSPASPTSETTARFRFADLDLEVGYQCSLDGSPFQACGASHEIADLTVGDHCLRVRAVDRAGNISSPTQHCWTVAVGLFSFTIQGSVTKVLYPGATSTVDLVLTNPNPIAIKVTSVVVTVAAATTKAGAPNPACNGATNLTVTRQLGPDVVIPGRATRTLTQLGVPESQWPLVTMPNLPVNQDACKATTFTLNYSGAADIA